MKKTTIVAALCALLCVPPQTIWAQGQDSTPGERSLLIMAELLPGIYDNANQAYFDGRRGLAEELRHGRLKTEISRIEAPALGRFVFAWTDTAGQGAQAKTARWIATLAADGAPEEVVLRSYASGAELADTLELSELPEQPDCVFRFVRSAEHFAGQRDDANCAGAGLADFAEILLSREELWRRPADGSVGPFWQERARIFHCYADIPGVSGGRDEAFERYDGITLHDRGDLAWFETRDQEPRNIGIMLRSVTWHVNNEKGGNFNRDSLVLYAMERMADGTIKPYSYAFIEPGATRIGLNMRWMLVNCAMVPRDQARPKL